MESLLNQPTDALKCGHAFHLSCLAQMTSSSQSKCSLCQEPFRFAFERREDGAVKRYDDLDLMDMLTLHDDLDCSE